MESLRRAVSEIMSAKPVTVEMDDRLGAVKEIFDALRFHHLLVVENDRLFGVLSDRDLLKALSPNLGTAAQTDRDVASLNKRVHQIMTRKPITLHPENSVMEAIQVFNTHRISCIPIVDREQRPVGVLSWRDVLRSLAV